MFESIYEQIHNEIPVLLEINRTVSIMKRIQDPVEHL